MELARRQTNTTTVEALTASNFLANSVTETNVMKTGAKQQPQDDSSTSRVTIHRRDSKVLLSLQDIAERMHAYTSSSSIICSDGCERRDASSPTSKNKHEKSTAMALSCKGPRKRPRDNSSISSTKQPPSDVKPVSFKDNGLKDLQTLLVDTERISTHELVQSGIVGALMLYDGEPDCSNIDKNASVPMSSENLFAPLEWFHPFLKKVCALAVIVRLYFPVDRC